jgi:sulfide dehydrogenase [flavocytochrome c] flavoprotein subunit
VLGLAAGCASTGAGAGGQVVVVGGGYGGATAAKYIRMWSEGRMQVTLVEPNDSFISCPISNLVLGGSKQMADITTPYDNLAKRHGVKIVKDRAVAIDADKRQVRLAGGATLAYDRLVVSPGVDFMWDSLPGLNKPGAQDKVLHAWKAGPQTVALRKQLEAMPDGGVYALTIPLAPYRCPPGPYERACQVAHYFSQAKPKSKVLILDANDDVTSKGPLFKKAWADRYKGIIEYRPKHALTDVDAATGTLKFEFNDDIKAQVLNVIPPMRAGDVPHNAGPDHRQQALVRRRLADHGVQGRQERAHPGRRAADRPGHAQVRPHGQPARQGGGRRHRGPAVRPPAQRAADLQQHLLQLRQRHRRGACGQRAPLRRREEDHAAGAGSGGVSSAASELEGRYAMAWARNIWADTLA